MDKIQCQFSPLPTISTSSFLYDSPLNYLFISFFFQATFFSLSEKQNNAKFILFKGKILTIGAWNRAVRRNFGPKRDRARGCWRKLHIEGFILNVFHEIMFEGSDQRKNKMRRTCSKHEEQDKWAKVPKGNGPLWRPSFKWTDNINLASYI